MDGTSTDSTTSGVPAAVPAASPGAPASAAGAAPLSPAVEAARAEISKLTADKAWLAKYTSGDADAKRRMTELNRAAFPDAPPGAAATTPAPTAQAPKPAPTAAEAAAAQAEMARLRADKDFLRAYTDARDPGHAAAVEKMAALQRTLNPEAPAELATTADEYGAIPLKFDDGVSPEQMVEMRSAAAETAKAIGVDKDMTHSAVEMIERGIGERGGRVMDEIELQALDTALQRRWGDQYDAKMDAVETALRRGGKGTDWLRRALLSSGPQVAGWAFETLSNYGTKGQS